MNNHELLCHDMKKHHDMENHVLTCTWKKPPCNEQIMNQHVMERNHMTWNIHEPTCTWLKWRISMIWKIMNQHVLKGNHMTWTFMNQHVMTWKQTTMTWKIMNQHVMKKTTMTWKNMNQHVMKETWREKSWTNMSCHELTPPKNLSASTHRTWSKVSCLPHPCEQVQAQLN